ncbi:vanadium-dependent haloperoxidase [Hymenobacter coccineus]|uniref:Phosphatidic acid phosphatase type 2/haloperoxidase domain-containing protein n=1 Tax=Hymenobacter coccineus TaxID=1908235 RepID=A0A1G1TKA4_9BACT|nr:vanadium-dependent haloperoxidase [Hymenobacter coccineus]OGX91300.1 hypothetical protein BEN49_20330 [Hymenobacter coccineus]
MQPGDIVIAWNNIYLDVVRRIGGAPGPLSHMGAVMHLAMYEAVNQLSGNTYPNVLAPVAPVGTPDPAISAAYAACYALTDALETYIRLSKGVQGGALNPLDPFQVRAGAELHAKELINAGSTPVDQDSDKFGKAISNAIKAKFPISTSGTVTYDGLNMTVDPVLKDHLNGEWRDTGSGSALTPHWGEVPLFLLDPASRPISHYEPKDIPTSLFDYSKLLKSELYAAQVREVKRLGGMHSTERTPDQTEIAIFWANDLNGTSKPPGQLYTITQTVAKQQGTLKDQPASGATPATNGLIETARLFAMVGTAMVNASMVAWHAKYFLLNSNNKPLRLWRPETAIQLAATDGNNGTTPDPDWQPLSATMSGTRFSPNFPAYVSGHSTFGAAHAAAMRTFYDTDNIAFTATTEDPHGARDANGIRRTRSFTSFTQAALENGRSRIYLGVHYQFDASGGYEIGTRVGEDTAKSFLLGS